MHTYCVSTAVMVTRKSTYVAFIRILAALFFLTFPAFDFISLLNIKFSVCVQETHIRKDMAPIFINLGIPCKWNVRFTLRILYPRVQTAGICWIADWLAPCAWMPSRKKKSLHYAENRTTVLACFTRVQVTLLTALAGIFLLLFNNR